MSEILITPVTLGKAIKDRFDFLAHYPQGMLAESVNIMLQEMARPQPVAQALQTIHQFQRLYLVHALSMADHPTIHSALNDEIHFPTWKNYVALQAEEHQKDKLASLMVHGDPTMRHPIFLNLSDYSRDVGERVVRLLADRKDDVDVWIEDPLFTRRMMNLCDNDRALALGSIMGGRYEAAERFVGFRTNNTSVDFIDPPASKEIGKIYSDRFVELKKNKPSQFYTITVVPTEKDADLDQIPYDQYVDLFFRMCDVDWDLVNDAHKILIAKLNAGSELRITNNDGTDVVMDIKGFTFCNSRVAKNVPGSEVFSAPRIDSVNGKIVAKGRFIPKAANELIENITLEIENGRIVNYHADIGHEILKTIIETDEGSRYFGEIGIGTNPVLKQHITNSLMVEKIGGSFHMAIGAAYEYTDYLGDPVTLDNGNRSKNHWDITTMLYGKEGMMILDGEVIMQDGKFTDPAISYLNGTD
jgi:aminopeptidase